MDPAQPWFYGGIWFMTWQIRHQRDVHRWRKPADRFIRRGNGSSTEGSRRFVMEAARTFALS